MNIRIGALLLLLPFITKAQYSNIIKNDDISWAAESFSAISFDNQCPPKKDHHPTATPIKILQTDFDALSEQAFTDALISKMRNGTWKAYKDHTLSKALDVSAVNDIYMIIDTVITFDPETYEEVMNVVQYDLLATASQFKVKQLWFFNDDEGSFETTALAIAPLVKNELGSLHTPVWYKLPSPSKKLFNPAHKKVQYAAYLSFFVDEMEMQVLKGSLTELKGNLIKRLETGTMIAYDADKHPIPQEEVKDIFIATDTIYTIDPETYEANFEVVKREYRSEDINDYHSQQSWFFDPQSGRLQCRAEAIAPSVAITDEYGTLTNYRPLFFWHRE
ncbi:MAG: hypothetical protein MI974_02785 [Chitinophagales bacterium]|nr:hypothetical protein [Chitinophagales bacterium]